MMDDSITEGSRVTTRYFGGYEAVVVRQVHDDYLVVARMGGAAKNLDGGEATGILPIGQIEKITRLGPETPPLPVDRDSANDGRIVK